MEPIYVYGTGRFYQEFKDEITKDYKIIAFFDSYRSGEMDGCSIVIPNRSLLASSAEKILIMCQDIKQCFDITNTILSLSNGGENSCARRIVWGIAKYGRDALKIESLEVMPTGKIRITVNGISICLKNTDEYYNSLDTIYNQCYAYYINNGKKDVVIDVGMNIGDSTLFFLNNDNVDTIYAYEPFIDTFNEAKENLKSFLDSNRLKMFQFGLSSETCSKKIRFQRSMSCGQSTNEDINNIAYADYRKMGLIEGEISEEKIILKDVVPIFENIISQHKGKNIVLKMDCEGEEYGIIKRLNEYNILEKIDFVMLEWHYKGRERILSALQKAGFSYWFYDKNEKMGLVYAWNMNNWRR